MEVIAAFDSGCMLLDYTLPEMDGGEVMHRLGAIHVAPRVVLMTASSQVRELANRLGLRFYVPKPFSGDDLLDTVEHARAGLCRLCLANASMAGPKGTEPRGAGSPSRSPVPP